MNLNVVTSLLAAKSFVRSVSADVCTAHGFSLNAQSCTSEDADQARRDLQLSVGEHELLSTTLMRLLHVGWKTLLNKCLGPSQVLSMKTVVVYDLRLLTCMSLLFNAVHVSLLKWYQVRNRESAPPPAV